MSPGASATSFRHIALYSLLILQIFLEQLSVEDPQLPSALTGLAEIAMIDPLLFDTEQKRIVVDFVVKGLLMKSMVSILFFIFSCAPVCESDASDGSCDGGRGGGVVGDAVLRVQRKGAPSCHVPTTNPLFCS